MRVLGVVPARGGSKGIPRKNIRLLAGKALLAYTAEEALKSKALFTTILSTDDEVIAAAGRQFGLAVPFLRPPDLALDSTPTLPVVQHALTFMMSHGDHFDAVCLLQPTNPLRTAAHIDGCVELLRLSGADSAVSVLPVPYTFNPAWVYFEEKDGRLRLSTGADTPVSRRQDLQPAYHRDGTVYVTRTEALLERHSLYGDSTVGYRMHPAESINLDSLEDWADAEARLSLTVAGR